MNTGSNPTELTSQVKQIARNVKSQVLQFEEIVHYWHYDGIDVFITYPLGQIHYGLTRVAGGAPLV